MTRTAQAAATRPADAIDGLCDFPDWLSPIVVKELRQGLRQRSFLILYILLQCVFALGVTGTLLAAAPASLSSRIDTGTTMSTYIFAVLALALLVVQPLRGLSALSSETRGGTIDLLLLTRLGTWRITLGKWLNLMTQSMLLLVAIVPYMMIRYFFGGMNLSGELLLLAVLFLAGGMVCAAAVALSAVRSLILRVIFAVFGSGALLAAPFVHGLVRFDRRAAGRPFSLAWDPGAAQPADLVSTSAGLLLLCAFLTYALLEFGAARIAPPSEKCGSRMRLVSLAALALIPFLLASGFDDARSLVFPAIILIGMIAMADALSAPPRHRPLPNGRRLPTLLLPGWPSGALFAMLAASLGCGWALLAPAYFVFPGTNPSFSGLNPAGLVAMCYLVAVQPALILAIFRPLDHEPANVYLTALLGSVAVSLVIYMLASMVGLSGPVAAGLCPALPLLGLFAWNDLTGCFMDLLPIATTLLLITQLTAIWILGRRKYPSQP